MNSKLLFILCSILAISCSSSDSPMQPEGDDTEDALGNWETFAALPTPRQEVPHVVLDGKIYVPGGINRSRSASAAMEIYEPDSDSWSTGAPLPERLHHLGMAAAEGTLYILGGYVGNGFTPTSDVYELNRENAEWNRKANMPTARGAHAAVEFEGKIYVIGGADRFGRALGINERYDPESDTWITLTPMPTPREHLAAAVIDTIIYVVGGRSANSGNLVNSARLEAYSPSTNSWTQRRDMPTSRGGLAAAALHGKLYAFGGEFPGVFIENEEYDPATNAWRKLVPMPTPRHGIGAAAVNGKIFVIGGGPNAGFGTTEVNEAFSPPPD
ncbi:galactose oxidase [candidate division KSB1 bacterium]|nr:galactose oxidase [candidate division KSB1 bacterium]NIU23378.1 galactose oxidase [candidate division KSB1 bacterium]NIU92736.1 galactose oxidase [candidate division KSB1 bacterium]NIV92903.1 galactose oxidase [candidate division KSB1 bacterium]NIW67744.1 galactose oxidase [candidate division KSB1 bacterium]